MHKMHSLRIFNCVLQNSRAFSSSVSSKPTLAVFTGNSQSGSACLKALVPRAKDYRIVALVRTDDKRRVLREQLGDEKFEKIEVVSGVDARDKESMKRAFKGVDRLMVVTPHVAERGPLARDTVQTAKESGVTALVVLTSWTSAYKHPLFEDQFKLTEDIAKRAFPHCVTVLRAGYFMTNLFGQAKSIAKQGVIRMPFSESTKFTLVDPSDIGATAAASLVTSCRFDPHVLDVTGPKAYTPLEIAEAFSNVLGKAVIYERISADQAYQNAVAAGMPEWAAAFARECVPFMEAGALAKPKTEYQQLTGKSFTLEQFIEKHRQRFLQA